MPAAPIPNTVIIGGGLAATEVALKLQDNVRVTIIDVRRLQITSCLCSLVACSLMNHCCGHAAALLVIKV